ncbi:tetratricopeptide repeat-containing sensor histidine kinase [Ichthyenterobacterium magnum]|uniref:histidine kinase n=1 Tax=Ichthyenterobacterium magnum TaxID=1230530 RepID=A0A420DW70_9FLAO|nr:tetratricopeptide repeat-containing sensor histidine kinase [Ichthyenterobacterium magnum]RKE98474.1 signal transduction histidine kinase [Ichthyenterobacterium magnum]
MRLLIFFIFLCLAIKSLAQENNSTSELDSILFYRSLSKDPNLPLEEKLTYSIKSSRLAHHSRVDTTILNSDKRLSVLYYLTENYNAFKEINHQNLELANKLKDSSSIVIAYHNLAIYHDASSQNDSAYYYYSKALKLYNKQGQFEKEAQILVNISYLQQYDKDYFGSEENTVRAIKIFTSLPESEAVLDQLWILYNQIGIISFKLNNYEKALEYYNKALEISEKMDGEVGYYNTLYSKNNQAIVYRKIEDLDKSIELYQSVIDENDLDVNDPSFYALTLGNLAYAKSLKKDKDIKEVNDIFKLAYKISDTIQDPLTKLGVAIDYSRFYLAIEKKDSALHYANLSYKLSKELSSNDLVLESLLLLSKLEDAEKSNDYLNMHIKLSDSLLNVERNVRNKYARIELETEELEQENERISQQKLWLSAVSIALLITLTLVYIIITQRAKNKELKFIQDQQKANEEIYNLMLSQQDKVDEARANEKKRISEELHDGILGRLFGTRLSLDSLNFSEGKEAITNRANYIGELKIIEQDIRQISHDLNTDFVSGSGFMDIVSELIEKQAKAYQLKYDFNFTDDINWEFVPNKTKINIYRVIQESLQNIYKHANAKQVKISFQLKNNVICLAITDDGEGFDVTKSKKGIGLKNINSRVDELEGKVEFNSKLDEGTTVEIKIPYSN